VTTPALASSLLSRVTGLFLGVAAVSHVMTGRRVQGAIIGVAAGVPLTVAAFFSNGGVQPIGAINGVPSLLSATFVLALVPRRWKAIRIGAAVYGLG
jgi:ABC-type amino acid transport system permease subunit